MKPKLDLEQRLEKARRELNFHRAKPSDVKTIKEYKTIVSDLKESLKYNKRALKRKEMR